MPPNEFDLDDVPAPSPVAQADPFDLDDIPAVALERRGTDLAAAFGEGIDDIGRMGLTLPALGEQLASLILEVPEGSTPFSDTLRDMALGDASRRQMAGEGYAPASLPTTIAEGVVRSGTSMVPGLALAPAVAASGAAPLAINAVTAAPGAIATAGNQMGADLNDPEMGTAQLLARAALQGGIELGGELIPIGRLGRGPEQSLAEAMGTGAGGASMRSLALDPVAQSVQEALTGGAQSLADDATGTAPVSLEDALANAGESAGVSALTGLALGGGMSAAAQGANLVQDRRAAARQDQDLARAALDELDPAAATNGQAPAAAEADLPLEVTPEVIATAQRLPELLRLFGIRAPIEETATEQERQRLAGEQAASEEAQARRARQVRAIGDEAADAAADRATGEAGLRAADDAALRELEVREIVDAALGEKPRGPQEAVGREPDTEPANEERKRFEAGRAAAEGVQSEYRMELQAITDQRQRGEIGKAQAFDLKRAAKERRDQRMAQAIQEATETGRADVASVGEEQRGVPPAVGAEPDVGGDGAGALASDAQPVPSAAAPAAGAPPARDPAQGSDPRPAAPAPDAVPSQEEQDAAVTEFERIVGETATRTGKVEGLPSLLSQLAPLGYRVDRSQGLPAGAERKRLALETAARQRGTTLEDIARGAQERALEASTPATAPARVPLMVTKRMVNELRGLGYKSDAIGRMTPQEAQTILEHGTMAKRPGDAPANTKAATAGSGVDVPAEDVTPFADDAPPADEDDGRQGGRLMLPGQEFTEEDLIRQQRKAEGDRRPVSGRKGWRDLQDKAARAEQERFEKQRRLSREEAEKPTDRIERKPVEEDDAPGARQNSDDQLAVRSQMAGRLQPAPLTGAAAARPVKKIRDMVNGLADWLGMQTYVSRKLGRNAAGYYDPASGAQVLKRSNDLSVFAHETGHWLDDRFGLIADGQGGTTDVYDHELLPRFAPFGSSPPRGHPDPDSYRRAEGVAEWIRAWAMNPEAAEAAAPLFTGRFRAAVPEPVRNRLREFGDDIRRFHHAPAIEAGAANIVDLSDTGPTLVQRLAQWWAGRGQRDRAGNPLRFGLADAARVRLTDRLWPLAKAIDWAGRETNRPQRAQRAENLVRLLAGINDKVGAIARVGMIKAKWLQDGKIVRADDVEGGIEWLAGWVDASSAASIDRDLRDLDAYMVAQSVSEQAETIDRQRMEMVRTAADRIGEWYGDARTALDRAAEMARARVQKQGQRIAGKVVGATEDVEDRSRSQAERTDEDMARVQGETGKGSTGAERRADRATSAARERLAKRTDALSKAITGIAEAMDKGTAGLRQDTERQIDAAEKALERRYQVKMSQLGRVARRMEKRDAERKARLSGQGGGTRADDVQAERILLEVMNDPVRRARLDEGAKRYRAWADGVLRYLVDKGRMSRDSYQQIKANNEFYVAMQRDIEDLTEGSPRPVGGGKIGTAKEVVKKRRGSTRTIENPLTSLLESTAKAVEEADRNEALRAAVDLMREARRMHDPHREPSDVGSVAVRLEHPGPGTVKVFRNGEEEHWKFAPEIQEAIKGLSEQYRLPWIMTILPSLVRTGIVKSPPFAIRNRLRDIGARLIIGQNQPGTATGWAKRLLEQVPVVGRAATGNRITDDRKAIVELAGGAFAGHYLRGREDWQRETARRVKDLRQDKNTLVVGLVGAGRAYNRMIESSEFAGRADEFWNNFEALRADGVDEMSAALMASRAGRDLVDFGVSGTWVGTINQVTPFLNAAVQGLRATTKAMARDPAGFTARWAMFSVLPSLLAYGWAASGDEDDLEEYSELPAWRRDLFWNFKAGGQWISIPKPFELGVTGSGVERALEAAHRVAKGEDAAAATARAFDGFAGSLAKSVMPVEADSMVLSFGPLVETFLANKSFYTGKEIIPRWEVDKPVAERTGAQFASRLGHVGSWLAGGTVDPRQVDHLVRGIFGQLGGLAADASDLAREDKSGTLGRLAAKGTGLGGGTSPDQQVSVARFLEEEGAAGRGEGKAARAIGDMRRAYWRATSTDDRERIAEAMRDYATGKDPLRDFDRAVTASNQLLSAWRKLEPAARAAFARDNREALRQASLVSKANHTVTAARKAGKPKEQVEAMARRLVGTIDPDALAVATKGAKAAGN